MITETKTEEQMPPLPALRAWLEKHRVLQQDLAELAQMTEANLSQALTGKRHLSLEAALRIALVTDLPVDKLLPPGDLSRLLKQYGMRQKQVA